MMEQQKKDEQYMRKALAEAQQAMAEGEIPIGAVVVCNDRVIARAHNLTETLECKQLRKMELAALNRLPKKMAQVYRLTRFEEKTSQELAEELHISKRTVEYHLLVSRREIRSMLRKAINW